jgi:hypothetical protein
MFNVVGKLLQNYATLFMKRPLENNEMQTNSAGGITQVLKFIRCWATCLDLLVLNGPTSTPRGVSSPLPVHKLKPFI